MLFKDMISRVWGSKKPLKQGKCGIFTLFNPEGSNMAAKILVCKKIRPWGVWFGLCILLYLTSLGTGERLC